MIVTVNERQVEVDERTTVAALLKSLGFPDRGIAVALDQAVLPRSSWATRLSELSGPSGPTGLSGPIRLEVMTAVQGG
ncbi:thiamine biosynthesis protein ThiS [Mycobacterium alsense]|uniref:sulfur carrier protein ThiS n=1 Tax=Mycobacterium alsense TaxID=324058 RepID=UPI0007FB92D9|nr:sulfur carrier protein ThiS [Mycobacterium alsense]OBI95415.1 thiamine biosynthesis protein ThiS [Mycobacterium alsense]